MKDPEVPRHVGIIMDGNRRWAQKRRTRLMARISFFFGKSQECDGHKMGAQRVERIVRYAFSRGVRYLTLFAFSNENWSRSEEEISHLMDIFRKAFDGPIGHFYEEDISVHFIGNLNRFPQDLQQRMTDLTARSRGREKTLIIAMGYGGRDEIVRMARKVADYGIDMCTLEEDVFNGFRDAYYASDLDLIIRTGGMPRSSGFCMWQSPYANFLVTKTLWPAFTEKEFDRLLQKNVRHAQNHGK